MLTSNAFALCFSKSTFQPYLLTCQQPRNPARSAGATRIAAFQFLPQKPCPGSVSFSDMGASSSIGLVTERSEQAGSLQNTRCSRTSLTVLTCGAVGIVWSAAAPLLCQRACVPWCEEVAAGAEGFRLLQHPLAGSFEISEAKLR